MASLTLKDVPFQAIQSSSLNRKIAGQRIKGRVAARSIRRVVFVADNVGSSSACGESTSDGLLLSRGGYGGHRIAAVARGFQPGRGYGRSSGVGFPSVDLLCTSCASAARTRLRATPSKFREAAVQDGENIEPDVVEEESDGKELTVDISGDDERGSWWDDLPDRYKTMFVTSLAFVICNMDKVNMSVAIIPMSHQLGWNAATAGLVQSSFFWGYGLSQLPGGWLAKTFTGKKILRAGVLLWSLATAALPTFATFMPALLFSRLAVGLGEGVSPSAATDLIARTIPSTERARAVAFVYGGLNVGSVAGLLIAPQIIKTYGWETVFYVFGLIGILWCFAFEGSLSGGEEDLAQGSQISRENGKAEKARLRIAGITEIESEAKGVETDNESVPWKEILKSPAVWAMIYAQFCGNWGHYTLLSWLPTYFSEELNLDLTNAAAVSILPALCSIGVSSIAAPLADKLISNGVDTTLVRKCCQSIAFISPAACMAITCLNDNMAPWAVVGILTAGIGLSSVALSGLYCTHQDMSPKYASVLLGITSTAGAIPGIVGVALVGYIFDETQSWDLALFAPSIFFYLTGAVVWNLFASSEPQSFKSVPLESKAK